MIKEEIIRMAREAGLIALNVECDPTYAPILGRFAALVLANTSPQSSIAWQEGFEAGQFTEREACAKLCDDLDDDLPDGLAGWQYGEAIRAMGSHLAK